MQNSEEVQQECEIPDGPTNHETVIHATVLYVKKACGSVNPFGGTVSIVVCTCAETSYSCPRPVLVISVFGQKSAAWRRAVLFQQSRIKYGLFRKYIYILLFFNSQRTPLSMVIWPILSILYPCLVIFFTLSRLFVFVFLYL